MTKLGRLLVTWHTELTIRTNVGQKRKNFFLSRWAWEKWNKEKEGGREGGGKENIKVQERKGSQSGDCWWRHSSRGHAHNAGALRVSTPGWRGGAASAPVRCVVAGAKSGWREVEPRMGAESPCQPFGAAARKLWGKKASWDIPKPGPHTRVGSPNLYY